MILPCWLEDGNRKRISERLKVEVGDPFLIERENRAEFRALRKTTMEFVEVADGADVVWFAVSTAGLPMPVPNSVRLRIDAGPAHGSVFVRFERGDAVVAIQA